MNRKDYMSNSGTDDYLALGVKDGDVLRKRDTLETFTIQIDEILRGGCFISCAHRHTGGDMIPHSVGVMRDNKRYMTNKELKAWKVITLKVAKLNKNDVLTKKGKRSKQIKLLSYMAWFRTWDTEVSDTSNSYGTKHHETIPEEEILKDYDNVAGGGRFMGEINREAY